MGWKESEKLYFLKLVKEKKAVLFGKFMDTLTRDDKKNEWITIINKCRHDGFELVLEGKDWTYVQDYVWPNTRQYSMKKIDDEDR